MSEEIKESASGELSQGDFKVKKKPKKLVVKEDIAKVDLGKKEEPKEEPKEETKVEKLKQKHLLKKLKLKSLLKKQKKKLLL